MKFISHRGNIDGKNKHTENHPDQIMDAIELGYDVEIDVWSVNTKLWLGHDAPEYDIDCAFLLNNYNKLLIHCKNDEALFKLHTITVLNIFTHTVDPFTISTKNNLLIHPNTKTSCRQGILIMPEMSCYSLKDISEFDGVISDNVNYPWGLPDKFRKFN